MTFKIQANPTFEATITLVGQGREQRLKLVFRHMTRTQYRDLLNEVGKEEKSVESAILELIDSWDADAELSIESLRLMDDHQPGAAWSILAGYGEALGVARKGN